MATDKPGRFDFVSCRDIRLSYAYAYREMTKAGLWDKLATLTQEEMFKTAEFTQLKMRKGSSWASTLACMWTIAHQGWEPAVKKLLEGQEKTD
jgi:hypothetical protein